MPRSCWSARRRWPSVGPDAHQLRPHPADAGARPAGRCGDRRADPGRAGAGARPQGRRLGRAPRRQPRADADRSAAGRGAGRPCAARRCEAASLPPAARDLAHRLAAAVAAIRARAPTLRLTIDPVEFRGFRYETGVSVTIYAPGRHEELGRGGRYICGEAEPATGLTLFPDAVLRAAPPREARPRLYVPLGADQDEAARMRRLGLCHHRRAGAGGRCGGRGATAVVLAYPAQRQRRPN